MQDVRNKLLGSRDPRIMRLNRLVGMAGDSNYERIKLAAELLDDKSWVRVSFCGDCLVAANHIQEEYLHDIAGFLSIWDLLRVYRAFPDKESWQERNFNFHAMFRLTKEKTAERKTEMKTKMRRSGIGIVTKLKEQLRLAQQRIEQLEAENADLKRQLQESQLIAA